MTVAWAAGGAAAGVPIGALLRGVVFRLSVPSGDPDRAACPRCAHPAPRWIVGRCGGCGSYLATPLALELVTAVVLALLLGRFGGQASMAAFGLFGVLAVTLAAIDIAVHRLPDRLTLPAFPVLITLLAIAAAIEHHNSATMRAVCGGMALAAAYLLLAVARPGQLGGGDIKVAGLAGIALGWLGWHPLVLGGALGFVLFAVVSLALLAARRITLRSTLCFGPFLLGGALLAIISSGR